MHPLSRSIVLGASFMLLFLGLSAPLDNFGGFEHALLANVGGIGVSFGVLPNLDNTVAEQLQLEEDRLRHRERMLLEREAELDNRANADLRSLTYVVGGEAVLITYFVAMLYLDRRDPRRGASLAGAR